MSEIKKFCPTHHLYYQDVECPMCRQERVQHMSQRYTTNSEEPKEERKEINEDDLMKLVEKFNVRGMTTYETNIGILTGYENSNIVTVGDLKTEIRKGSFYMPQQYADWRYGTNLQRFLYDPYTGEKIDWIEVRYLLTKR